MTGIFLLEDNFGVWRIWRAFDQYRAYAGTGIFGFDVRFRWPVLRPSRRHTKQVYDGFVFFEIGYSRPSGQAHVVEDRLRGRSQHNAYQKCVGPISWVAQRFFWIAAVFASCTLRTERHRLFDVSRFGLQRQFTRRAVIAIKRIDRVIAVVFKELGPQTRLRSSLMRDAGQVNSRDARMVRRINPPVAI